MSDPLQTIGLTREGVARALRECALPAALVLTSKLIKGRQGRRGLPENMVKAMYDDYLSLKSLNAVGKKYGRSRQAIYDLFHGRGWKCYAKNWGQKINYGGRVYTPGKSGYFRATTGDRRALHHQMWLDRGNTIPPGYQVSFRDGDCTNFAPGNLFCDSLINVTIYHQRRLGKIKDETPETRRARLNANAKRSYQKTRMANLAKGLTTLGKVRQRHPNFVNRIETFPEAVRRGMDQQAANTRKSVLANYHRRAEKFVALGLNTRGKQRSYKVAGKSQLHKSYDHFRAGINTNVSWDTIESSLAR